MKHRGLASPYINGLGCACNGKPITRTGLGNPATMATTVANFHTFLNELETKGVPREVTNRMLDLVKDNIQKGIDPNMHEIVTKAYAGTNQGLGATFLEQGVDAGMTAINNINVGGVNVGNVGSQLVNGNFVGAGFSILNSVIPIDKTFGAVFANGFDLSCWGASYSESKAKEDIKIDLPLIIQMTSLTNLSNVSLDNFLKLAALYIKASKRSSEKSNFSKCTRKGYAMKYKAMEVFVANTIESIRANGFILTSRGVITATATMKGMARMASNQVLTETVTYEGFTVSQNIPQTVEQSPTKETNTTPVPVKKQSSLLLPLVGVGVLAAKFLI